MRHQMTSDGSRSEVGSWRKPRQSFSNGNCVEVGHGPQVIAVRDTKNPGGPALQFTPTEWGAFLHGLTG